VTGVEQWVPELRRLHAESGDIYHLDARAATDLIVRSSAIRSSLRHGIIIN
jgi:hypothetical protein